MEGEDHLRGSYSLLKVYENEDVAELLSSELERAGNTHREKVETWLHFNDIQYRIFCRSTFLQVNNNRGSTAPLQMRYDARCSTRIPSTPFPIVSFSILVSKTQV